MSIGLDESPVIVFENTTCLRRIATISPITYISWFHVIENSFYVVAGHSRLADRRYSASKNFLL